MDTAAPTICIVPTETVKTKVKRKGSSSLKLLNTIQI